MTLTKIEDLVADEKLRCDASSDLIDRLYKNTDPIFRSRHIPVAYQVKRCEILKGQKYKRYEFVDEDGEMHEFKCLLKLDDYMRRHELYAPFILEEIQKLKDGSNIS